MIAMLMVKNQTIFLHGELKFTFLKILRKKFNCIHHHGHFVPWLATKSIHRLQNSIFLIKFSVGVRFKACGTVLYAVQGGSKFESVVEII